MTSNFSVITPRAPIAGDLYVTREWYRWFKNLYDAAVGTPTMALTLDVTLVPGSSSTPISDPRIGPNTAIIPGMALNINAAADFTGGIYVDTIVPSTTTSPGSAIVHHRTATPANRTIRFVFIG